MPRTISGTSAATYKPMEPHWRILVRCLTRCQINFHQAGGDTSEISSPLKSLQMSRQVLPHLVKVGFSLSNGETNWDYMVLPTTNHKLGMSWYYPGLTWLVMVSLGKIFNLWRDFGHISKTQSLSKMTEISSNLLLIQPAMSLRCISINPAPPRPCQEPKVVLVPALGCTTVQTL